MTQRWPVVLGVLLCMLLLTYPISAADNPGLINFDPREVETDPGDEFDVDVLLQATAHDADDGVAWFNYTVTYPADVLSVTDVEIGPWIEQGEETTVSDTVSIDPAAGAVSIEQERDPPAGGVVDHGVTPTATITFEVAADAAPADAVIEATDAEARLTDDWPLPVLTTRESTVSIAGGGEMIEGSTGDPTDTNVILAEDIDDTSDDEQEDVAIGEPAALPILLAVAGILLVIRIAITHLRSY